MSLRDSSTLATGEAEAESRGYWQVIALTMGLCFISHMNRVAMSVAGDERIMGQFRLSPTQMGAVYSAFIVVYAIGMVPGGFFIDRFGPRLALMVMGFGTALFAMLTGLTGSGLLAATQVWTALLLVRGCMGFLTVPLHPGCARAISLWVPRGRRAWANGLATGAALLGIACTYQVVGSLIDRFDWPVTFLVLGVALAVMSSLWMGFTRRVRLQPDASPANATATGSGAGGARPERWTILLRNRSLVLLTFSYAALSYFQYMFFYWMHYYFDSVLNLGKEDSRFYASLPTLAMAVTMPLGGWLSDFGLRRWGAVVGRKLMPAAGMALSAVFLGAGLIPGQSAGMIVAWFTLAMGALGLSEGPFWLTAVALGGRRGGTAAAILNTGGNGIGLFAPVLTPALSAYLGWQWGIGLGGGVCLLGALCWWGVDATKADAVAAPARP